ncbi:hypothetical protein KIH87_01785 [Paraneptunicella aestuarii]|uniref:hypothetical protein n=1 Tax=Paraneptunicella aestuarii TaxID=2831148 RepID=UPI001E501D89|nr:hypothetical protein [Paraneptunicella aestuarii]UAA39123.1 hypothetical protein KIH87_01785 [Paraneptunicella aestuarii]
MDTFVLVLDESGAKGYSNNQEVLENEFGVMAGFIFSDKNLKGNYCACVQTFSDFASEGKLHITELSPDKQKQVRTKFFEVMQATRLNWSYEAIKVQGLYESENIRIPSEFTEKVLLHERLFIGLVLKVVNELNSSEEKEIKLKIITDNIDRPIVERFCKSIDEIIKLLTDKKLVYQYKKSDPIAKKSQIHQFEINVDYNKNFISIGKFDYSIKSEDSCLTFMADILVNSVYHHLKKKLESDPDLQLNSSSAIQGYPLAELVGGCRDEIEGEITSFSDFLYRREAPKE